MGFPAKNGRAVKSFVTLKRRRGSVPWRRVATDSVIEHFDGLEHTGLRNFNRWVVLVVNRVLLYTGTNDSIGALSSQVPAWLILQVTPC